MPKPFEIFEDVYESLKVGGWLAVYAPYIDQAEIAYRVAKNLIFTISKYWKHWKEVWKLDLRESDQKPVWLVILGI